MQSFGSDDSCPFSFNFDPTTFKVGDMISYRVPEAFGDMPFVGEIVGVYDDYIEIAANDPSDPGKKMKGTRESRPVVARSEAL